MQKVQVVLVMTAPRVYRSPTRGRIRSMSVCGSPMVSPDDTGWKSAAIGNDDGPGEVVEERECRVHIVDNQGVPTTEPALY